MSSAERPIAVVVAALALSLPALAVAQDAAVVTDASVASAPSVARPNDDEARRLFEQSLPLLNEQRFAEAMPLLERSVSLREHPAALAALAASYRGVGRYLRAIATLERLLATTTDQAREAEVRGVLGECRRALAHVTLRTAGEATEVLVDGERIATGNINTTLELDPGAHRFEVRRMGYEPVREERQITLGQSTEVALDASAHPLPATLVIETPSATTTIRVDGVPVGRGRATQSASSGRHAILVAWDDGHTQERVVELAPGARMVVSISPNRAPTIWTRWWLWTGVGAVAVGLVVGGVVLFGTRTEAPPVGSWGHVSDAIITP